MPLLFLAHRLPYPPNKGDKIRSFNLLKHLAQDYPIFLGTFVDDADDWRHVSAVQGYCEDVCAVRIYPKLRKVYALKGLLTDEALSVTFYRHSKMSNWVSETLKRERITNVLVYSSPMAQYIMGSEFHSLRRILDFVDVDSEKWRQYSSRHRGAMRWLYAREAEKLLSFERRVAGEFDSSVFVTAEEASLFRRLAPEVAQKTTHIHNGVDTFFFRPRRDYSNPYAARAKVLVFTGAMDYWSNVDAVTWFAQDVFPFIRASAPRAEFYIVGARPTDAVRRLAKLPGVEVTGAVRDIRPYLAHAVAAVAPLRVARGLQNKVLEAMAMAKPVLATPAALDGIRLPPRFYRLAGDEPEKLAQLGIELLLKGDLEERGTLGRRLVEKKYTWTENLMRFESLLGNQRLPNRQASPMADCISH